MKHMLELQFLISDVSFFVVLYCLILVPGARALVRGPWSLAPGPYCDEARREWYRKKSLEDAGRKAKLRECMSGLETMDAATAEPAAAAALARPLQISWTAFKDDELDDIFSAPAPAAVAPPQIEEDIGMAYSLQEAELRGDDDDDDDADAAMCIDSESSDSTSDNDLEGGMFVVGDLF